MARKTKTFEAWSFLSGGVSATGFFFFSASLDEVNETNSTFFVFDEDLEEDDGFGKFDESVAWPAISMATLKPEGGARLVVAIGNSGETWELSPSTGDERCDVIPGRHTLRRLAVIGDGVYACGMNRTVLERQGPGAWRSFGPGAQVGDPAIFGFEALAGASADELYAVGWGGEIWWCSGGVWRRVESPTKENLTALACAADGSMFAVGHGGVMVKGRRDRWERVDTGRHEDLRDVAVFDGQVFALSAGRVWQLGDAGLRDSSPAELSGDALQLLQASDGLVLVGRKQLFTRREGSAWSQLA